MNPALDRAIRTQKEVLLSILNLLFDLGLEDRKRYTPWEHIVAVEWRRAERGARCAEAYAKAEKILAESLGKRWQPDSHLKERMTDGEANEAADCNEIDNGAEPVGRVSPTRALRAISVLEKLANLVDIQDQRVLELREEENKVGFINPRLDSAISLHKELLLSIQGSAFDLALDRYHRRSPREQMAEYWEQEQHNQRMTYEAFKAVEEILSQDSVERRLEKLAADETLGDGR